MTISPRSLSDVEFRATFVEPMREITGREDEIQPEGVIDVVPYLAQLGPDNLDGLDLLPNELAAAVYASGDNRFHHVMYKCNRSNTYAVVVVSVDSSKIHGHHVLDLGVGEAAQSPVV